MPKKITEYELFSLYKKYVIALKKGKYNSSAGTKIKKDSIENYFYLEKLLRDFSIKKNFNIRIKIVNPAKKKELEAEQKYWNKFYKEFTDYLYNDLGHFDNYVASITKLLKAFFNYLSRGQSLSRVNIVSIRIN